MHQNVVPDIKHTFIYANTMPKRKGKNATLH